MLGDSIDHILLSLYKKWILVEQSFLGLTSLDSRLFMGPEHAGLEEVGVSELVFWGVIRRHLSFVLFRILGVELGFKVIYLLDTVEAFN